ncbi:MAG: signal recognition particle-docking protein FtsY [Byssovorax sp.]
MDPTFIAIAIAIVLAVVGFLVYSRSKAKTEQIEAPPEERQLPKATQPEKAVKPVAKPATETTKPVKPSTAKTEKPAPAPTATETETPAPAAKPSTPPVASTRAEPAEAPAVVAPPSVKAAVKPAAPRKEPAPLSARKRDVEGLRKGLSRVREKEGFFGRLKSLFTGAKEIDPQIVDQIEEVLLSSDVGVKTTEALLADIKDALQKKELADNDKVWQSLREHAVKILSIDGGGGIRLSASPTVVMVIGVNGVGKTTTIGKLATKLKADGKKVVLAAGDTFRAAAVQQLNIWGKRVGCEVVSGKDGANPGAVIFDAIQRAKETGADVVLADTAGRLHTKSNLMDELTKVSRTMAKALDGAPHETLLVLDATNGQNAMQQAAMFKESLPISGIVLTKLDGTAKGGVILGICAEHNLPVRYIGIGERAEDLRDFVAEEFVEAMLGQNESADAAA